MQKKDIPNALCWFRIALIPFVLLFLIPNPVTEPIAEWVRILISGLLFGLATVSDLLDGKIARKYNYVSDLGKFLDPVADKMLVLSILVAFSGMGVFSSVWTILILLRELLVTGLRLSAASKGNVVAANYWGKIKTASQCLAVIATYLCLLLNCFFPLPVFTLLPQILLGIVAVYTCISAVPYIKACAPYLKG